MKKELIEFLTWYSSKNFDIPDRSEFIESTVDEYLNSINSAQRENSNVSDNEKSMEIGCHNCLYKNNGYKCANCSTAFSNFEPIG